MVSDRLFCCKHAGKGRGNDGVSVCSLRLSQSPFIYTFLIKNCKGLPSRDKKGVF
ncbi:unnamed protein product [Meloidogyne enterolobii]|uniref:Uncharacterized protein n=1 Tax=Meloidogyne enterolobii TaxID=390850 RepID=A0ACB0XLG5_MELEN